MKQKLMILLAACLMMAYTPVKTHANADALHKIVHHGWVYGVVASDGNSYDIEFTYNLSTNHFGILDITGYSTGVPITYSGTPTSASTWSAIPSGGSGISVTSTSAVIEFVKDPNLPQILTGITLQYDTYWAFDY